MFTHIPNLGVGLGLRPDHYPYILEHQPKVPWFEIISENYMHSWGAAREHLFKIAKTYPVAMHGVSLSIGSVDPLDFNYLNALAQLAAQVKPWIISDHLCFTGAQGFNTHDLLPLPYTQEAINHVSDRIKKVQDVLSRPIAIENVSSYVTYNSSNMPEWEFISAIAEKADCMILLDVNNVYVSSFNHQFDAKHYIDALSPERVAQYHLAGFTDMGDYLFDTHSKPVHPKVWELFQYTLKRIGKKPTLIEWDDNIPEFEVLHQHAKTAESYIQKSSRT